MAMRMQQPLDLRCGRAGVNLFTRKLAYREDLLSHLGPQELPRRFSENGREAALRARHWHRQQVLTYANALNALQKRHTERNLKLVCIRGWQTICQQHHRNRLLKWNWPKVVEKRGDLL